MAGSCTTWPARAGPDRGLFFPALFGVELELELVDHCIEHGRERVRGAPVVTLASTRRGIVRHPEDAEVACSQGILVHPLPLLGRDLQPAADLVAKLVDWRARIAAHGVGGCCGTYLQLVLEAGSFLTVRVQSSQT